MRVKIGHAWITGRHCIGIVVSHDPENPKEPYKAHIETVPGIDPYGDLRHIQDWGMKLDLSAGVMIIDKHGTWDATHDNNDIHEYLQKQSR